jgi:hypothetical protein
LIKKYKFKYSIIYKYVKISFTFNQNKRILKWLVNILHTFIYIYPKKIKVSLLKYIKNRWKNIN